VPILNFSRYLPGSLGLDGLVRLPEEAGQSHAEGTGDVGAEYHHPFERATVPEEAGSSRVLTDDEYQSILYAEADAHKRFMRAAAYFPDASSLDEVVALATEVLGLNNALDNAGTTIRTVETVEEIQEPRT
jgi:hypothetical protein